MDALALLCTLHADGPATWRRLRESECHSLADLSRFEPAELAEILGGTLAGAKRFLREARHLDERVGTHWLEREEGGRPAPERAAAPVAANVRAEDLPPRDQQILDEVLRAWRDEDEREEPPEGAEAEAAVVASAASASTSASAPALAPRTSEPSPAPDALVPGLLDGLDESACERLHAEGVHTLGELAAADLAPIALHGGLGFSRLYRWRSLAERRLRALHASAASAARSSEPTAERLSPAEVPPAVPAPDLLQIPARPAALHDRTPRWSPIEEGAAGPFA